MKNDHLTKLTGAAIAKFWDIFGSILSTNFVTMNSMFVAFLFNCKLPGPSQGLKNRGVYNTVVGIICPTG